MQESGMERGNRLAVIAIVVEDPDSVSLMNETLHDYGM